MTAEWEHVFAMEDSLARRVSAAAVPTTATTTGFVLLCTGPCSGVNVLISLCGAVTIQFVFMIGRIVF